jgi:solute carrier family 25 S-adenosylmethionine transporter 26
MRSIYTVEGPKALFRGIVPRVLWISGGGAVFLGVYEQGKKLLGGELEVLVERGE